jgi:exodeoxyribonuclease VII small subunit
MKLEMYSQDAERGSRRWWQPHLPASGALALQFRARTAALELGLFSLQALCLIPSLPMASPAKKAEISFETAMERLEKIVEEMESGKMLLEDLLVRYEEGMKLVKVCQDRLAHAEQKIQIITRDHAGKTSVKDFATTEPPIASTVTDSMKENDDVRLF